MIGIFGPCSIESEEQILEIAHLVKECGGTYLRGGVWKYRSDPMAFQGFGLDAIEWLKKAKAETGLKIVTEVFNASQADFIKDIVDMYQVGSRNAYNSDLLKVINTFKKPVLYKRHFAMSLNEFVKHSEYLKDCEVMMCLRGVLSLHPQEQRFFPDITDIPRLRELTKNKICYDVSHSGCDRRYIPALIEAAQTMKPDGLMIETHKNPNESYSDPLQALDFPTFRKVTKNL